MLIQAGATVDVFNSQGHTPLHVANEYAVAKLLIEGGADVDLPTINEGETALHKAARAGDGRLVLLLLAEGSEVGIVDAQGIDQWRTSGEGHVEMLKLFWTAGAWR
ncbi:uncharacterized protein H6S33_001663 [Morchella sextelata]|uniref:uncharacterized protein n=1 Tax=Morchella sextelata TaxID=1174677 RepID=UPI001D04A983|nr:uncharacterized protein H6S33_001663 [Morchella sextelata]KAH0608529.1 hypothetical protein H6S33_001663 [Morchella sextelata]